MRAVMPSVRLASSLAPRDCSSTPRHSACPWRAAKWIALDPSLSAAFTSAPRCSNDWRASLIPFWAANMDAVTPSKRRRSTGEWPPSRRNRRHRSESWLAAMCTMAFPVAEGQVRGSTVPLSTAARTTIKLSSVSAFSKAFGSVFWRVAPAPPRSDKSFRRGARSVLALTLDAPSSSATASMGFGDCHGPLECEFISLPGARARRSGRVHPTGRLGDPLNG
eukprot:4651097-Prymnesium_polylepis.2